MSGLHRKHTAHFSAHSFISAIFLDHTYKMPVKSSSWKGKDAKCWVTETELSSLSYSPFFFLPSTYNFPGPG